MFADEVVGLTTQVYEQLETAGRTLASIYDIGHVRCQYERSSIPDGKDGEEKRRFKCRSTLNVFGLNPLGIYKREVRTSLYLQNYNYRVHHYNTIKYLSKEVYCGCGQIPASRMCNCALHEKKSCLAYSCL